MSAIYKTPSIFDSFNARNLSPVQIAQTFIPSRHFDQLISRSHSLIIGPRGSGKTTLLKMLQTPALEAWKHPKANEYRQSIDFTGVFVAADVSWGAQISSLGKNRVADEHIAIFSKSAFTTHALLSFIASIRDNIISDSNATGTFYKFLLPSDDETILVNHLADAWMLKVDLPRLFNLTLSLRKRLLEINSLVDLLAGKYKTIDLILSENRYLNLDLLGTMSYGIDVINEITNNRDHKWALLFDELEIAPKQIRQTLLQALRSTDHRLLFKLSISPYNEDFEQLETSISAMSGHDFVPIKLWYAHKEDGYEFCAALLRSMLLKNSIHVDDPESIFGGSDLESDDEIITGSAYKVGSANYNKFKSLCEIDSTFYKYIRKNDINLELLEEMSEVERARKIRKITSLVSLRLAYRKANIDNVSKDGLRSRKNPALYSGLPALFAVTEGNPRWFIGIMNNLLNEYLKTHKKLDKTIQSYEVNKTINRFRALLKTISINPSVRFKHRGLLTILDKIGVKFFNQVVVGEFVPEPAFSFTVDSDSDSILHDAIGKGLNSGALIYIPDTENEAVFSSVKGKRFRLSYLLSPYYGIPLSIGRSMSLSKALDLEKSSQEQLQLM